MRSLQSQVRPPTPVDEAIRDLLAIRAVNLRPSDSHNEIQGFSCIGIADSVDEMGTNSGGVFIWLASKGILPVTGSELTRWGLDAPSGFHWILSERPVEGGIEILDSLEVEIWGPAEVSKWLGEAVLMGDLVATSNISDKSEPEKPASTFIQENKNKALRTLIDPKSWMSQRGIQGVGYSPVFLEARVWSVGGYLQGPNGELESGNWTVLEDPWSPILSIIHDEDALLQSPDLRVLEPSHDSWLTEARFSEEVGKLLNERRKGSFADSADSGSVRSILLQRWTFNGDRAAISHSSIQIPGWIVHFETDKILHGRNGRLYEF